uniref:Uncharacterized protein n=1 Tax=Proboscia inermis TaxID=420281 RepID=A0A7S0CLP0_9STRA|mmetsp:Transcript_7216/g.7369  ORF Transcript_7216/g.7369 Transcript_7216/m.7369 type:complete len:134 (+) Transcript_7216:1-402(+)
MGNPPPIKCSKLVFCFAAPLFCCWTKIRYAVIICFDNISLDLKYCRIQIAFRAVAAKPPHSLGNAFGVSFRCPPHSPKSSRTPGNTPFWFENPAFPGDGWVVSERFVGGVRGHTRALDRDFCFPGLQNVVEDI